MTAVDGKAEAQMNTEKVTAAFAATEPKVARLKELRGFGRLTEKELSEALNLTSEVENKTKELTGQLNTMIAEQQNKLLPLGVHFGLAEDRYHADPGIGSTDIRRLTRNPAAYWYYSWMNPRRPADTDTPSQIRGSALHHLVYLGEDYFQSHYMCGPDQSRMSSGEKSASTRKASEAAANLGCISLKHDDYDRICIAAAMITRNPELASVFTGGASEVSIFWEHDGIRCKARLDYLKIRGIGDLKSCANPFDVDFPQACRQSIARYAYAEQATWYMEARSWVRFFVASGRIYGSDYDPDWLAKVAEMKEWGWQWVFYGMDGPPLTWSAVLSPANPIVDKARAANAFGLDNYRKFMDECGTDLWLLDETPTELMIEELPIWAQR